MAISEAAGEDSGLRWQRLVRAGITKELCGCLVRAPNPEYPSARKSEGDPNVGHFHAMRTWAQFHS